MSFIGQASNIVGGQPATGTGGGAGAGSLVLQNFAAGTAYSFTAVNAALTFGTTQPVITITAPGTYLILASANIRYNAATYAANQTITLNVQRTNNTPAAIANTSITTTMRVITAVTDALGEITIPFVTYTTTNSNDILTINGVVSAIPAAGSVDATGASIMAVKLS